MANSNKPAGFTPVRRLDGAKYGAGGNIYCIPSTDTNAYAVGDLMTLAGDGDANGIPTVILATAGAGNQVLGSIVSAAGAPNDAGLYGVPQESPVVIPATKTRAYYVLIADDPNLVFEAQEDGLGGTIAAASVGLNVSPIAGTNNGYVSGWLIDSSTVGAGATLQLKLLRAVRRLDNALGTSCKWEVKINNHCFGNAVAGL